MYVVRRNFMWGPVIEFWTKKDVDLSEKKLDFINNDSNKLLDNDFDRSFDGIIQNLDMEIDYLRNLKKYLIHLKEEFSKNQKLDQFTDYSNSHKSKKVLFKKIKK